MYSKILGYDCVFDEMETYMKENGEPDPFTYGNNYLESVTIYFVNRVHILSSLKKS